MDSSHIHSISELSTETLTNPDITPEKLSIMKLRASLNLNDRDLISEPGTPTGHRNGFDFSSGGSRRRSSSIARSSSGRQTSTSIRRSIASGHSHGHSKFSSELVRQSEGKFFALMDLVASASREAISLKEVWSELIAERESLTREREELMEQITEVTETLENKESEHSYHGQELVERKKQIDTLIVELSSSLTSISEYKKREIDHEHELLRTRNELQTLRDSVSRHSSSYELLKSDFESLELRLRSTEDERDHAKKHGEQYHEELRSLTREHTDLKTKSVETITKLETARKEILSFTDRLKISELERENYLVEKERVQELHRRANVKIEETSMELVEITGKYEHQQRDINKHKETIRDLESEFEISSNTVDHLRREIKTKSTAYEEAESRASETKLKLEHLKKENLLNREKLTTIELERTELQDTIEKSREEYRVALLERNQFKDDVEMWKHRHGDKERSTKTLLESLRKTESTLTEVRTEVRTLTDRLSRAERERAHAHDKHEHLHIELKELKEKLVIVQGDLRSTGQARDRLREELHEHKQRYEEVTETMTEFRDSSGGYEFEIENLRTMLREAREQKERAIAARNTADRERDESIARYEEKCREMERFEQSASSHFHSVARAEGGKSSSRVFSRSSTAGTTVHNGHSHMNSSSSENREGGIVESIE